MGVWFSGLVVEPTFEAKSTVECATMIDAPRPTGRPAKRHA